MKLIAAIGHMHHPVALQSPPRIVSLVPSITECCATSDWRNGWWDAPAFVSIRRTPCAPSPK